MVNARRVFLALILLGLFASLGACTAEKSLTTKPILLPIDDGNGKFVRRKVTLNHVTDLESMTGDVATLYGGGKYIGSFNGKASLSMGEKPKAQFIDIGDALVPADFETMAMATIMYHMEKIKEMYDKWGLNEGISFPRRVMVNPQIPSGNSVSGQLTDNATFMPGLDGYAVFTTTLPDAIPVSISGGIWSHEYFHNVFNQMRKRIVAKKGQVLPQEVQLDRSNPDGDMQNLVRSKKIEDEVLGAVNEGTADFFAYVYSGNPKFFIATFTNGRYRDMTVKRTFPSTTDHLRDTTFDVDNKSGAWKSKVHFFGSFWASFLYQVSILPSWGTDKTIQASFDFLNGILNDYYDYNNRQFFSFDYMTLKFFGDQTLNQETCDLVKHFSNDPAKVLPQLKGCRI